MNTLPARSEAKLEETWRLEDIFPSDEAWEGAFTKIKEAIPTLAEHQGKLGESAQNLFEALKAQDEILEQMGKLYTYSHMRSDQDTANSTYQSLDARAKALYTEVGAALSYVVPEILSIEEAKIEGYLEELEPLKVYRHALKEINMERPHILSADKEEMLAQFSDVVGASANTFGMLNNADMKFPTIKDEDGNDVELTHGRYMNFLESNDRSVREAAFKAMYATYGKFKNTFSSTLSGAVKKDNLYAKLRHYKSAREAALSNNHIPESVYDNLVETIHEHLPLLHRYIALRKKVMKLDELHMYDLYTPLLPDTKFAVTYEEAQDLMKKGLEILGDDYQSILEEAFENRWVDVRENQGKRSGAYSSGTYGTNPYILMNWQDNVNNLFTLAHEFGHSVHSYYSRNNQPYVYGNYSIFVAEVASTTNEALLNHYLLQTTTDKNKRLYLLNNYLETFRGTIFRQTMFAEFEHLIHKKAQEGIALTADSLTEWYYELNQKYFGPDMVIDEEVGLEWARIPHFYYNYYVFQYATGLSAAAALSKQIIDEGQPAVDRYIGKFLKAGSSDFPIEVLKAAGVDMNAKKPIEDAMKVFEEYLTEMENLLG